MRTAAEKTAEAGDGVRERPADRLLATATDLFSRFGIRAVGVDRILREADCAKASLYSAFGSKDALVVAYLTGLDTVDRERFAAAIEDIADPVARALTFFDLALARSLRHDFPGCLYTSAASEFPGVRFPPIDEHREWVRTTLGALLKSGGVRRPAPLARQVQLLYDGALVASKVDRSADPIRLGRGLAAKAINRALADQS